ncbi:rad4 transglutaminase-like domain-containing protein [Colletotrichum higginsianum]|nr:rad4 transglutaminase-like domain-containing protein [Colletotrichum higginsianum]
MCPEGAAHVPFRGAVKVCKRLKIDYAEAVVDFEFGNRMAVPVIQGVVIAEEYHDQVMEEIRKDEVERARKEDEKRRKEALRVWNKFLKGLRIVERIRQDYGQVDDSVPVFQKGAAKAVRHIRDADEEEEANQMDAEEMRMREEQMAGGFFPEGHEEEEVEQTQRFTSGFFPVVDEGDEDRDMEDALVVDHGGEEKLDTTDDGDGTADAEEASPDAEPLPAPVRAKPKPKKKAATRRSTRRRRRPVPDSEDEDEGRMTTVLWPRTTITSDPVASSCG